MSRFTAIDLSGLKPPDIIENLDYEAIVTAMRDDLLARFPLIAGVIDLESEPARKLIEAFAYTAAVIAAWGRNLQGWDISPALGRGQYSQVRARWYDLKKAEWQETEEGTSLAVDARHDHRYVKPNEDEAAQQAGSDKATSERDAGEGSVTIEGDTAAIPDGLCILTGARPGIDGPYRIESVTHSYSRGGGFITQLSLKRPGSGGAGAI